MKRFALVLISSILLFSCKKEADDLYTKSALDKSFAEMNLMDVVKQVTDVTPSFLDNGVYENDTLVKVSITSNQSYPQTITVNYGETNHTGKDGKNRRGKILIIVSDGDFDDANLDISFDKFYLNDTQILGDIDLDRSNDNFDLKFLGGITYVNANGTMKWTGNGQLVPTGGANTIEAIDDTYSFTYDSNGQDFSGTSFTSKSTVAHLIAMSCRFMVTQGTSSVTPNNRDAQNLAYGTGSCDGNATVTSGSQSEAIVFQ